jgi:hypothetical protein
MEKFIAPVTASYYSQASEAYYSWLQDKGDPVKKWEKV